MRCEVRGARCERETVETDFLPPITNTGLKPGVNERRFA